MLTCYNTYWDHLFNFLTLQVKKDDSQRTCQCHKACQAPLQVQNPGTFTSLTHYALHCSQGVGLPTTQVSASSLSIFLVLYLGYGWPSVSACRAHRYGESTVCSNAAEFIQVSFLSLQYNVILLVTHVLFIRNICFKKIMQMAFLY